MTAIFTQRLISLGRLAIDTPVEDSTRILSRGDRGEVSSLLSGVKGVGPKVLANFLLLRSGACAESPDRPVGR